MVGQKLFRPSNTETGQKLMWGFPRSLTEGSTEMKSTQVNKCGKFVEPNCVLHHVAHVRSHVLNVTIC